MNTDGWQKLIEIQNEEEKIINLKKRFDQLQAGNLVEINLQRIKKMEENLKKLEEKLSANTKIQKENEAGVLGLVDQQKEILKKLYGGTIHNSKELNQLQKKSDELKEKISRLEEATLSLMLEKESLLEEKKKIKTDLDLDKQEYEKTKKQFELEQIELKEKLKTVLTRRKNLLPAVSQSLYDWYTKLRKEKGGRALVPIVNGTCDGCHVALPNYLISKVHFGKELLTCENCGRILYWKE